ncbi:protein E6-like [Populus nigra]|uniref:protein E6-like n=1 Tax=Populus nigra TaxID=3691 RepID=UPI002B27051F|nr:protein E6-like [Populus nigra]
MAPSPRLISFLFFLTIFSKQIHARESQFFSKVGATTASPSTTTINNNNVQDKTLPSKEEESFNKQELDPAFIPDTQNGYGLYGQESSQFPTTTKLANAPYTTATYQPYKTQTQTQETYTNYPTDSTTTTTTNNHYNNNAYEEQQQNFGETSLQESEYTNMGNQNSNKYYNGANSNNNKYYNGANSYNNDEKQGMSDTRYLEHGKYYYDVNNENSNYYPNQYQQNSRNNYNTRGYYNNNNNYNTRGYYNNNENSKYEYNNNSMQKYDNQDDFEESQEEQYVP